MVRYVGGKTRIFKHFKHHLENKLHEGNSYVEPFVGGGNSIAQIDHRHRFGNDTNKYVVALLKSLSDGWVPPHVTSSQYQRIKSSPDNYDLALVGFAMFSCSFGGKEFGGFTGDANTGPRDHVDEQVRACVKQGKLLSGIVFTSDSYDQVVVGNGDVVYCDPPYKGTLGYGKQQFNYDMFSEWVNKTSKYAHVFISEFTPLDGFDVVWQKDRSITVSLNSKQSVKTELLLYRGPSS